MMPDADATLHVHTTAAVVDGEQTAATLTLERMPGGATVLRGIDVAAASGVEVHELGNAWVLPAPLDLHFHGAGGHVVPPLGDPAAIDAALMNAFGDGVSYEWLATLPIPQQPPADPVQHVADAAHAIAAQPSGGWCRGIRIEGLFLNPTRAGVWPPETFREPGVALLEQLVAAAADAGSALRIIDVAPELDGALTLIEHARELGVVVSLAHTDATWEQAVAAIDAGATLATHTWNAMRPVSHRDPGIVAAVLADPRVTCELICDGVHLHPGTIALSVAACGPGRWVAISDASPFAGAEPGTYDWAGTTVLHDGVALRDHAGRLAGSASLLDAAPAVLRQAGCSELDALLAITADPRRVLAPTRSRGLELGDPVWILPR